MQRIIKPASRALLAACAATTLLALPTTAHAGGSRIVVRPGESIQAALDSAAPGTTIVVRPGTYAEQLRITTDDIALRARNVVLVPPTTTVDGTCQEPGATGICVIGDVDGYGGVIEPVRNVSITGITVRGFGGTAVYAYGADGISSSRSTFLDNGGYGIFARRSSRISFTNNLAVGNESAGFYVGINPDAQLHMTGNRAFRNREGLLLLDTVGGTVAHNRFEGNCVGILLASSGAPDQPAAAGIAVVGNDVADSTLACGPIGDTIPPLSGAGIVLAGTNDVLVAGNTVTGSVATGPSGVRSGISVVGTAIVGPPGTGNRLIANHVRDNLPVDIELTNGGDVEVIGNDCGTSDLDGVCDATITIEAVPPAS